MNYNQAIKYIHQTPKFSRVLGNDLLRALLEKMNNPHKTLSFIHIAGTNGTGSAAAWTAYSRSAAMRLEAFLKKLKKTEKEELGSNPKILFEKYKDRFVEGEYNVSN